MPDAPWVSYKTHFLDSTVSIHTTSLHGFLLSKNKKENNGGGHGPDEHYLLSNAGSGRLVCQGLTSKIYGILRQMPARRQNPPLTQKLTHCLIGGCAARHQLSEGFFPGKPPLVSSTLQPCIKLVFSLNFLIA